MELSHRFAASLTALSLWGAPSVALAQESTVSEAGRGAAQQAYRRAVQLFDQGRHAEALAEFQRANSLAPSFRIQYNVGLCQVALGDSLAAVDAFSAYLREGGEKLPPDRRAQVESEIARLTQQLASLELTVRDAGAEVMLDDERLGNGPLERRLRVNAGAHRVTVRGADGSVRTRSVTLAAGAEERLRFEALAPTEAASFAPAPAAPPRREVPWLAWGITGALGAATAVTGVLALGAHGDESDAQRRQGVTRPELDDARSKVEALSLATDVLLACTALSAGTALYLTLRPARAAEPQTALRVGPGFVSWQRSF